MVFRQKKWHLSIRIQSGKRKKTAKFWRSKRKKKNGTEEENDLRGEGRYRWRRKKTFMKERAVGAIQ